MRSTYIITTSTPIGPKTGTISFTDNNGNLSGSLNVSGGKNPFTGGKTNGNSFEFSGILKMGLMKFDYTAKGIITGDALKATAITKFGILQISGVREE